MKGNTALKMIAITSPGDFKKQHKAILLQAAVKHWKQQQDYSFFFFVTERRTVNIVIMAWRWPMEVITCSLLEKLWKSLAKHSSVQKLKLHFKSLQIKEEQDLTILKKHIITR